jgi:hypothetical protein
MSREERERDRERLNVTCDCLGPPYYACEHWPTPAPGGRTRDVREEIARALRDTWEEWDDEGTEPEADEWAPACADIVLTVPSIADALAGAKHYAAEQLRAAAEAARGMHDPPAPDCVEWADWLDARADALSGPT